MRITGFIFCSLFFIINAFAQNEACRPLVFSGTEIGCLSRGQGAFTKDERGARVEEKLKLISEDPAYSTDSLHLKVEKYFTNIVYNEEVVLAIHDDDFEMNGLKDHLNVAPIILNRMVDSITSARRAREPKVLLQGVIFTGLATIGLILWLLVLRWVFPKARASIVHFGQTYIRTVRIQSFELVNSQRVISFADTVLNLSRLFLILLGLYIYIPLVFSFFPWTETWADKIFGFIIEPIKTLATVFVHSIPNLFFVAVIVALTYYILKFVRFLFHEIEVGHLHFNGFYQEWAEPTYKLVRVLVIAMAFVMAFPYLPGSNSPAFQGVSVFLGILISFGSSSAIGNVVAGVVITYMRPFKIGQRVKIADTVGDVVEKTLLVTRIRTIKNVDITIPNSIVLSNHIVNYSAVADSQGLILNTSVTIGYDAPWPKVHELLIEAAKNTEGVDLEKKPFVFQTALNDFAVAYEINAYTKDANRMAVTYSELHRNIQVSFNKAGVEILSPHYNALRVESMPSQG